MDSLALEKLGFQPSQPPRHIEDLFASSIEDLKWSAPADGSAFELKRDIGRGFVEDFDRLAVQTERSLRAVLRWLSIVKDFRWTLLAALDEIELVKTLHHFHNVAPKNCSRFAHEESRVYSIEGPPEFILKSTWNGMPHVPRLRGIVDRDIGFNVFHLQAWHRKRKSTDPVVATMPGIEDTCGEGHLLSVFDGRPLVIGDPDVTIQLVGRYYLTDVFVWVRSAQSTGDNLDYEAGWEAAMRRIAAERDFGTISAFVAGGPDNGRPGAIYSA